MDKQNAAIRNASTGAQVFTYNTGPNTGCANGDHERGNAVVFLV